MAELLGYDADLVHAIVTFADANDLPPELLLGMGIGESDLNMQAAAESEIENSYGVFQINVRAHGRDREWWSGLEGAARAMAEMLSRWHATFVNLGGWASWVYDPNVFLHVYWPRAQGSVQPSRARANTCAGKAHQLYVVYLKAQATPATESTNMELVHGITLLAQGLDDIEQRAAAMKQGAWDVINKVRT